MPGRLVFSLSALAAVPTLFAQCGGPRDNDNFGCPIRTNAGFNGNVLTRSDNGSSELTPIGFTVNLFNQFRSSLYVNTNGNVTIDSPDATVPTTLQAAARPMIAAFLADVDTRATGSGTITYGPDLVNGRRAFGVNYHNVGYAASHADKLNDFQLVLIERSETGIGNFDVELNYERWQWESADTSGGVGGLGGSPALLGFTNGLSGTQNRSFQLRALDVVGNSIGSLLSGRTVFQSRQGVIGVLTVIPSQVSLRAGQSQQFTSIATNLESSAISWSVAGAGSIDQNGVYRAPASITIPTLVTVKATSLADSQKSATATVVLEVGPQGCEPIISPSPIFVDNGLEIVDMNVSTPCQVTVSTTANWILASTEFADLKVYPLYFQANPLSSPRTATVSVVVTGFGTTNTYVVPVAQRGAGPPCSYAVPTAVPVPAAGGPSYVDVTTQIGCPWQALSNLPWVTITSSLSFGGSGRVTFSVDANGGSARTGTVFIAGQAVAVRQAPAVPTVPMKFVSMAPCRLMETRPEYNFQGRAGAFGPPFMNGGETRTLNLLQSTVCPVPATAKAVVMNVTLVPRGVPRGGVDFVTIWPGNDPQPTFWTIRSPDGQIVANSTIVKPANGVIQVYTTNTTDLLLDISGYFTDDVQTPGQTFYPLTPCRVIDTRVQYRSPAGPFGPPTMNAGETRRFRFPSSPYCSIPVGASAYSVTITAVPPGPLQFLTAWPAGGSQPNVSNINSPAGRVLANSVILPASADGSVDVFAFNQTDFLMDINGYFAPDNGAGLFYFPVTQCRVSDSRITNGTFGGPIYAGGVSRTLPIPSSACWEVPATAKAYALSVTAVPNGSPLPFLTVWPSGQAQPNASILNAFQGQVVTNSAIIPAGINGSVDLFALTATHVVVEVSGYFGR